MSSRVKKLGWLITPAGYLRHEVFTAGSAQAQREEPFVSPDRHFRVVAVAVSVAIKTASPWRTLCRLIRPGVCWLSECWVQRISNEAVMLSSTLAQRKFPLRMQRWMRLQVDASS